MKPYLTEPMLAANLLDPSVEHTDDVVFKAMQALKYPVIATLKVDGIRALMVDPVDIGDEPGVVTLMSRRWKRICNDDIRTEAVINLDKGLDMELYSPDLDFHEIDSIIMSANHPDWKQIGYWLLDDYALAGLEYVDRYSLMVEKWRTTNNIKFPQSRLCNNAKELFEFEKDMIASQGEGICFRTLHSPYKFGRSTLAEQYLVKLTRMVRAEAKVIGFEEAMANTNKSKKLFSGKSERSSNKNGMVGKGTLGALKVQDIESGIMFKIGTGMNDDLKNRIWNEKDDWYGAIITYKSKPHGRDIKPRTPVFIGRRND